MRHDVPSWFRLTTLLRLGIAVNEVTAAEQDYRFCGDFPAPWEAENACMCVVGSMEGSATTSLVQMGPLPLHPSGRVGRVSMPRLLLLLLLGLTDPSPSPVCHPTARSRAWQPPLSP